MLEPRIVATRIQIRASALQGTSAPVDRIAASSQGVLIKATDAEGSGPTMHPSIIGEEAFTAAVDVGYGCGNPNINHD
jgi:hypothetical protein